MDDYSGVLQFLVSRRCVSSSVVPVPQPSHHTVFAALLQMPSGFQAITTVVAWAAGDPDAFGMGCNSQCQARHSQSRALHQRVGGQVQCNGVFQEPCLINAVQRVVCAGRDLLHGLELVTFAFFGQSILWVTSMAGMFKRW